MPPEEIGPVKAPWHEAGDLAVLYSKMESGRNISQSFLGRGQETKQKQEQSYENQRA